METLPPELLFQICAYLDVGGIVNLLATSKQLRAIAQDQDLWKSLCFEGAALDPAFTWTLPESPLEDTAIDGESSPLNRAFVDRTDVVAREEAISPAASISADALRTRSLTNWDPSYPEEEVDWYEEYIARYGPLSINWLETPITRGSGYQAIPESKGLAFYSTSNNQRVISPLDDGSVCLWDISHQQGTPSSRGMVFERSRPGLISANGQYPGSEQRKSRSTGTGIVECISVDNFRNKIYVAAQSKLHEIDLLTMQVSSHTAYPFSISALSEIQNDAPLTVGTNLTLHLHDHRRPGSAQAKNDKVYTDTWSSTSQPGSYVDKLDRLLSGHVESRHATLFQPGPLSILHMYHSGASSFDQGEIFVAGRFPSILMYDRRTFPRLRGTLHSGARLSSIVTLPYSFKLLETDLMRYNQLSIRQVEFTKSIPGNRIIACGEYNGKGSLEIYGLDAERQATSPSDSPHAGVGQSSSFKNRVSASRSKLLSIANHGMRLVVADSDGNLRWLERNGSTFVRAWNMNHQVPYEHGRQFAFSYDPNMNDVARKILPTPATNRGGRVEQDEILVWTGERIGVLGFTERPRFGGDPDVLAHDELQAMEQDRQHQYEYAMRRTLERQADEVRWMNRFGRASYY